MPYFEINIVETPDNWDQVKAFLMSFTHVHVYCDYSYSNYYIVRTDSREALKEQLSQLDPPGRVERLVADPSKERTISGRNVGLQFHALDQLTQDQED